MINENVKQAPWHQRTLRFGQTNFTEMDPVLMDMDVWRAYWRERRFRDSLLIQVALSLIMRAHFRYNIVRWA